MKLQCWSWAGEGVQLSKEAETKTSGFIEEGESLVKPELKEGWREFVSNNTKDFYSATAVEASLRIIKALSEDKSPEEAEKSVDGIRLSGFQMGYVAGAVSHFHPRGEEFRQYWNRKYLPKEKAEKTEGVVNPAILIISPK